MNETIWSRYEASQYADTPQNWKHLQARKGQFHEIHPGYYAQETVQRLNACQTEC